MGGAEADGFELGFGIEVAMAGAGEQFLHNGGLSAEDFEDAGAAVEEEGEEADEVGVLLAGLEELAAGGIGFDEGGDAPDGADGVGAAGEGVAERVSHVGEEGEFLAGDGASRTVGGEGAEGLFALAVALAEPFPEQLGEMGADRFIGKEGEPILLELLTGFAGKQVIKVLMDAGAVLLEEAGPRGGFGQGHALGEGGFAFRICGQMVNRHFLAGLEEIFDAAEEGVGVAEVVGVGVGKKFVAAQLAEGFHGGGGLEERETGAVDELEGLGEKLDLADATLAVFKIAGGVGALAALLFGAGFQQGDLFGIVGRGEARVAELLEHFLPFVGQFARAGDAAGLKQTEPFPCLAALVVIAHHAVKGGDEGTLVAVRTQAQVHAVELAGGGGLLDPLAKGGGDLMKKLSVAQAGGAGAAAGKAGSGEAEEQIDIGKEVEFAAAQFAEADEDATGRAVRLLVPRLAETFDVLLENGFVVAGQGVIREVADFAEEGIHGSGMEALTEENAQGMEAAEGVEGGGLRRTVGLEQFPVLGIATGAERSAVGAAAVIKPAKQVGKALQPCAVDGAVAEDAAEGVGHGGTRVQGIEDGWLGGG